MQNINVNIEKISNRLKTFLEINTRANVLDLKLHLECRETELLMAVGALISTGFASAFIDDSNQLLIKKTK